ncbi:MAG: transglutaminase-like domain-containing protein [Ilumatobacteraceae bacterium]
MGPVERFASLIQPLSTEPPLDELIALVGAAFDHRADVDVVLGELDHLALQCDSSFDGVVGGLFGDGLLRGNRVDYQDPRNSYLHEVVRRRLGLPITLSVVAVEVGRRLGVTVQPVGLPGHFIVGDGSGRFADPFNRGAIYDRTELGYVWRRITGATVAIQPAMLVPNGPRAVAIRVLNNLRQVFEQRQDDIRLATLAGLRGAIVELRHESADHARWVRVWN